MGHVCVTRPALCLACSAKTATRPRKPKATPEEEAAELDAHNRNRIAVR